MTFAARLVLTFLLVLAAWMTLPAAAASSYDPQPADLAVPRYDHIIVIVEENEGSGAIIGNSNAPAITALAREYRSATRFYAETHPSEPNYVAMIGGDTFGIQDDDAFYCTARRMDEHCGNAYQPGYADHTVDAQSLPSQLEQAKLTWRGYFGGFDPATPDAIFSAAGANRPAALYAAKHNPFLNFRALRSEPSFWSHISPLDRLQRDLASSSLPNFAFVVPDQCDDMHGLHPGPNVPADCASTNRQQRIARGDAMVARLMHAIEASPAWKSSANVAVVLTFDENDDDARAEGTQGCCGSAPTRAANQGGGLIPTIVATNHGRRALADSTPYNHYSLLRTVEDAFGIRAYLAHAGDWSEGVRPMTRLFAR
ncbi:phosphoesterase [bacterium]|nr:MAG: phosphoesterase [bacterium]